MDFKSEIRKHLADLDLAPAREVEIVEELAQHAEDRYEELRGSGHSDNEAARTAVLEVCERLTDDDYVDASGIEVSVEQGVVQLAGSVDDRRTKRRAEDVAESVRGVKDIQNQLRVVADRD